MNFLVCYNQDGLQAKIMAGFNGKSFSEVSYSKEQAKIEYVFEKEKDPEENYGRDFERYYDAYRHKVAQRLGFDSISSSGYSMRKATLGDYIEFMVNIPGDSYEDFQALFSGDDLKIFDTEDSSFKYITKLMKPAAEDYVDAMNIILDMKELIEKKRSQKKRSRLNSEEEMEKLLKRLKK